MALSSELSALSARIVNKLPRPALVLLGSLYSTLSRIYQVPGARLVSKLLVAFGVLYGINKKLNSSALRVQGASRPWKWHQEVVLVTGGSSGIGAVMVRKFAQQKIKVAIIDINPPQDPLPPGVKYYNADVTSPEAVHDAAERIRSELGAPTVLINNAGIGTGETILSTTPELIQRTFGINIVSHFWTVREFLPAMIEQKHGHIVTIASMASFVTIAGNVDYSCTKAGALAFHEGLAQELQHRYNAPHIRTTIVHPQWVRTPMTKDLISHPLFRASVLEADDVAESVVKQVLSGQSGQIVLPKSSSLASSLRAFPIWLQEFIRSQQAAVLDRTKLESGSG